jgi:hypothetical protein
VNRSREAVAQDGCGVVSVRKLGADELVFPVHLNRPPHHATRSGQQHERHHDQLQHEIGHRQGDRDHGGEQDQHGLTRRDEEPDEHTDERENRVQIRRFRRFRIVIRFVAGRRAVPERAQRDRPPPRKPAPAHRPHLAIGIGHPGRTCHVAIIAAASQSRA